jgi:hypothetical protein
VDNASRLWVADAASRSLLLLSPAGELLQQVVPYYGPDNPSWPGNVCVDSFGQVYVLDQQQSKVCLLTANGSLISYSYTINPGLLSMWTYGLALSPQQDSPSSVGLYTTGFTRKAGKDQMLRLSMAGPTVTALSLNSATSARSVAVNSASVVYILRNAGTSILRVAANGAMLPPLPVPGAYVARNPGLAVSLAIDPADDSIVVLLNNQTVLRLSSAGQLLSSLSVPPPGLRCSKARARLQSPWVRTALSSRQAQSSTACRTSAPTGSSWPPST